MASPGSSSDRRPRRGNLGLGMLALVSVGLLAGLTSKGCASPSPLLRDPLRCPEPARSLALLDRRGQTVALVAPDGRSVSLAPSYTQRCIEDLGGATCASGALALDQGLQQRARELIGRGIRAARRRLADQSIAGPVSGMLVAMQADSRDVLVLVGLRVADGRAESLDELPRRNLGTAFKPLLAAAAIASGRWRPDDPIQPVPAASQGKVGWRPVNANDEADRPLSLADVVQRSTCCGTVRLAACLDPEQARIFLRDLGLVHVLPSGPTPGPGALDLDLLEVTNAYATLAAHGWSASPRLVLSQANTPRRVLSLDQVLDLHRLLRLDDPDPGQTIGLPGLAGKRGTTPDGRDGWFIGYKSGLAVGVWFGLPPDGPIVEDALLARLAEQVWLRFLSEAMAAG